VKVAKAAFMTATTAETWKIEAWLAAHIAAVLWSNRKKFFL
jgi:hypothetical protein